MSVDVTRFSPWVYVENNGFGIRGKQRELLKNPGICVVCMPSDCYRLSPLSLSRVKSKSAFCWFVARLSANTSQPSISVLAPDPHLVRLEFFD